MRIRCFAFAVLVFALAGRAAGEVVPGRNVNMVSGVDWPEGDPFLQRQNEGSMAASTRNPQHLLAGGNDYRTVDIPGLAGGRMTGDAWLGVFWSRDGGQRWSSTLLPGYPQDNSAAGLASPLKGLEAGADAVVRAGTNGLVYYAGIAFNRAAIPENAHGTGQEGKVFVARFIDDNAKETGNPFRYLDTVAADRGTSERFLDKPWLAVDVPRAGAGECRIPASASVPAQTFKGGHVYLSYTAVSGDPANLKTRLMFTRSRDCGQSWSRPLALTDGKTVDQGTVIAVHPLTGWVYVAWRRLDPVTRQAAFLIAVSFDGGRSFTKPIEVAQLAPYTLSDGATTVSSVFEQGTSLVSFRTTGFPALAVDALGIVYVAWSERGRGPGGDARIVVKRSPGGLFWWFPAETANPGAERGHELMPSLLYQAGRLLLVHYTLVEDHTVGVLTPAGDGTFVESRELAGDLATPADPGKVFREFVADTAPGGLKRRHTLDVWVRAAEPPLSCDLRLVWNAATRVSQYVFGDTGVGGIRQFQFNPPSLPLFACQGALENCRAFIGDYVDLAAGAAFVPKGVAWMHNLDPRTAQTAHAVWTDNRDVRPPPAGLTWADYTPPVSPFSETLGPQSLFDPTQARPVCVPGDAGFTTAGMRNQNLYTARLTEGLIVSSPQNAKPLGFATLPDGQTVLLQRSFVVVVQNTSAEAKTFRLRIRNQPSDGPPTGKASFLQFPEPGLPDPLIELFVNVAAKSSATRTVFVTSSHPDAAVTVDVQEATAPGGEVVPPQDGGLQASVTLNPDITNPDITNPDITNPDITNPDITNAEVYNPDITNPDITNPDITNPDITNPDITNPDITNPDITNPDITNVQVMNPDITNPDITNPDITNPDITNPDITNPDITNVAPGSYTDATWTVQDNGNTSGAYSVKLMLSGELPPGFRAQLILHRGHSTPVAVGCELALQRQSIVLANIVDPAFVDPLSPDITNPDITNPDITNATVFVGPGGDWVQVTLRLFDPDPSDAITARDVLARVTPVIVSQAVNTLEAAAGSRTPPVAVPGTSIVFTRPPARGTAGVPLSPPVTVQVRDGVGSVLPGVAVTLSLATNPSGASLSGATATTNTFGVAAFPLLAVDRAGSGYRLRASVGQLDPAFSAPFDVREACAAEGSVNVATYPVASPGIDSRPVASREAADFDGDGARDLAVIHGDGTITKMAGNGLGAFERRFQLRVPTTKTPRALAVGDLNQDGLSDLVVAYTDSSQLAVVLSDRTAPGTFFTAADPQVIALAGGPSALAVGDLDGDGRLDVVAALEQADAVAVLPGDGAGGLGAAVVSEAGNAPMALAVGRFDADGVLDVVLVHYPDGEVFATGSLSVLRGDGAGGLATVATVPTGLDPVSVATGDLDGDGALDAAVANAGGHDVTVRLGNGAGGWGAALTVPLAASPRAIAAADLDGDKRLDLATADGTAHTFSIVLRTPQGGFAAPRSFASGGVEPVDVSAGDWNRDGRPDLVLTHRLHDGGCCDNVAVVVSSCGATTADLAVQLGDAPDPVDAGGALTYTAVVTNLGPFAAERVVFTQSVPGPVRSASSSAGECTAGPPVSCPLGTLEVAAKATVTVVVTAPSGVAAALSSATARADTLDPRPADNTASAVTTVRPSVPDGFTKAWVGGTAGAETSWAAGTNWTPPGTPAEGDDVYVGPSTHDPVLDADNAVVRRLAVAPPARLSLAGFTLTATGDVDVEGQMPGPGTLRMKPLEAATLAGTVPGLKVEGLVLAERVAGFTVLGNLEVVAGALDLTAVVGVGGAFSTTATGALRMKPGAILDIAGEARFGGASTEDQLVGGLLRVGGAFSQSAASSAASFSASAGHVTVLGSGDATVTFETPGDKIGTSHFGTLELQTPGTITLASSVFAAGPLVSPGPAAPIVLGGRQTLTVSGLDVSALVLDDALLASTGGTLTRFEDVTFQNHQFRPRLLLGHPGAAAAFEMLDVDFGVVGPVEGSIFNVADTADDAATLEVTLTGASPADGCRLTSTSGGARVSWNGVACP
jgi:hypothetical protein